MLEFNSNRSGSDINLELDISNVKAEVISSVLVICYLTFGIFSSILVLSGDGFSDL